MSLKQLADLLKPKCLNCWKKARPIGAMENLKTVFCSRHCMEAWAFKQVEHAGYYWCPYHGEWHPESERSDCEDAKRLGV